MRRSSFSLLLFSSLSLWGNPQGANVTAGSAQIQSVTPSQVTITAADRSIIEWNTFSIGVNEITQFIQPMANATVLNRVIGIDPSQVLGTLQANGKVYLINPNGVVFGKDCLVDVGSIVASTLDVLDRDFLNQTDLLFQGSSLASLLQLGTIQAQSGDVVLLAHRIENQGTLKAYSGNVALGSAHEILLQSAGDTLIFIKPESAVADGILNEGMLAALQVELQTISHPHSLGIQQKGMVQAHTVSKENGRVFLRCSKGNVTLNETSLVNAPAGTVSIQGDDSMIINEGTIRASEGKIEISSVGERPFLQEGILDVSGSSAGSIRLSVPKFSNHGSLLANGSLQGGRIEIEAAENFMETQRGRIEAVGSEWGGNVSIHCGTSYFSSGNYLLTGKTGGNLQIQADVIAAPAAQFDVNGGTISLKSHQYEDGFLKINSFSHFNIGSGQILISTAAIEHKVKTQSLSSLQSEASLFAPLSTTLGVSLSCVCPQQEYVDTDPSGASSSFGTRIVGLSTGNVVITKPSDSFTAANAGAVYLYNATTGAFISVIRGSQSGDAVGFFPITALNGNGNFVIDSPLWANGAATSAGAVTWVDGVTGLSGIVSSSNSLVGSSMGDQVGAKSGAFGITALANGNYVVVSTSWDNPVGPVADVGAVTWGSGTTGVSGTVGPANSYIGGTASDQIGSGGVTELLVNGNYVIASPLWDNPVGPRTNAGAVTWATGAGTSTGTVGSGNSLVGSTAFDAVGGTQIVVLTTGNYVVISPNWDDTSGPTANVGAVTFGNGTTGISGSIASGNSLIGSTASDFVGSGGVAALSNGNYVVASPGWDNGGTANVGAVTWGDKTTGISGTITALNSIIGATADDLIGSGGIKALVNNGNYVISSPSWHNGAIASAGAATWVDGSAAATGTVSTANSLYGSSALSDSISSDGIFPLTNGNYVVNSSAWHNGAVASAGAVTWGNGSTGTVGAVGIGNSLVGSTAGDLVGRLATVALAVNGNYVCASPNWDNGATANVGAVTWGNGSTGTFGAVSAANSIIGSASGDFVGNDGLISLSNGNYVTWTGFWNNERGAATWGNGATGTVGVVNSSTQSIVGATPNDIVGNGLPTGVLSLGNGNYVVLSEAWQNGAMADAGAVTWGNGTTGTSAVVGASNSLIGTTANDSVGQDGSVFITSNGNYVVATYAFTDGTNANAGAVTLGSGESGTYCGTYGAITSSNSIIGPNANANLGTISVDAFNELYYFTFDDYNGQSRVFSGGYTGCSVPSVNVTLRIPAKGINAYLRAISETQEWSSMNPLGGLGFDDFAPMLTPKNLLIILRSLVNFETWNHPKIIFRENAEQAQ